MIKSMYHPIPPEQKQFLDDKNAARIEHDKGLSMLRDMLLEIGGEEVCLEFEPDLERLLKRGRTWQRTNKIKMMRGEPCHCHSNSAHLWKDNKGKIAIIVGWGLSDDGIWRQHTFCWRHETQQVVETTTRRIAYFGTMLTEREATRFYTSECLS